MKLNDYGDPKAVPSLRDTLAQEDDGRRVKTKKAAGSRPKGVRNPERVAQERTERICAAFQAENAARAAKGKLPIEWATFRTTSAYAKAWKGDQYD